MYGITAAKSYLANKQCSLSNGVGGNGTKELLLYKCCWIRIIPQKNYKIHTLVFSLLLMCINDQIPVILIAAKST